MAIDGVVLDTPDTPDTPENEEEFGRSGNLKADSPFPQVRVVGLAECGSHAVVAAAMGPYADYERALFRTMLHHLDESMLVLADRGFFGHDLWREVRDTGAHLLWRVMGKIDFPVLEQLSDGSYRSMVLSKQLKADMRKGYRAKTAAEQGLAVRIVEYTVANRGGEETIRLVTSLLDPDEAPAIELAALYQQRWEFELALDEIQTHQLARPRVLRSKSPAMVRQEVWALLLTHYAIRQLMWEAADDIDDDDAIERVSFMRTLRLVRRHVTDQSGLSPLDPAPETR